MLCLFLVSRKRVTSPSSLMRPFSFSIVSHCQYCIADAYANLTDIFPLKLSSVVVRPWKSDSDVSDLLRRFETSSLGILDPIRLVKTAIPEDLPIRVTEILPRLKDGGAYVKFKYDAQMDPAEIEGMLRIYNTVIHIVCTNTINQHNC